MIFTSKLNGRAQGCDERRRLAEAQDKGKKRTEHLDGGLKGEGAARVV